MQPKRLKIMWSPDHLKYLIMSADQRPFTHDPDFINDLKYSCSNFGVAYFDPAYKAWCVEDRHFDDALRLITAYYGEPLVEKKIDSSYTLSAPNNSSADSLFIDACGRDLLTRIYRLVATEIHEAGSRPDPSRLKAVNSAWTELKNIRQWK
jgi:hypothetical protein